MLGEMMFGKRFKLARERRGLTQEDVADALGVSVNQIYRWESGKNDPTGDKIAAAARVLGESSDYLLGLDDNDVSLSRIERSLIDDLRQGKLAKAIQKAASLSEQYDQARTAGEDVPPDSNSL